MFSEFEVKNISIKVPLAKQDLFPICNNKELDTKPIIWFEEFILLKIPKETYNMFVKMLIIFEYGVKCKK